MKRLTCAQAWIAPLLLVFSLQATAQTPTPPAESPSQQPRAADKQIALDVVVDDHSGKPVGGLQQSDFSLLDNKSSQNITSFHAYGQGEGHTEVILLVDAVNTTFTHISYERNQIEKFLSQNDGKLAYPTSLVFFEDVKTQVQSAPTQDGKALLTNFDQNVTGLRSITRSSGFYGAEERMQLSLKTLAELAAYESRRPGRKLVLWISPGWPMLSGPNVQMSDVQQRNVFNSIVALSTALRQSHITLYSVDPLGAGDAGSLRTFYYQEFLKPVPTPNKAQIANLALQVLATQSGGKVVVSSNDITAEINQCVDDGSPYYELTFDAAPAERPSELHTLQIKVDKPGLTARTRALYYAQP